MLQPTKSNTVQTSFWPLNDQALCVDQVTGLPASTRSPRRLTEWPNLLQVNGWYCSVDLGVVFTESLFTSPFQAFTCTLRGQTAALKIIFWINTPLVLNGKRMAARQTGFVWSVSGEEFLDLCSYFVTKQWKTVTTQGILFGCYKDKDSSVEKKQ